MTDVIEQFEKLFAEGLMDASENFRAISSAEQQTLAEVGIGFDEEFGEDALLSARYKKANVNTELLSLVEKVEQGGLSDERVYFGVVSKTNAEQIHRLMGIRVDGYKVAIEARQIKHILKDHGKNGLSDNSMADNADIAKMEFALDSPDDISASGKTQAYTHMVNGRNRTADTVLYEKNIGEKSYYVVQAVPDTKAKTLFIVSAFIGKKGYKKEASQLINAKNLDATAKTGSANASAGIISQPSNSVNTSDENPHSDRKIVDIPNNKYVEMYHHFGSTKNYDVAGYILGNGIMLDFSGKHWGDDYSTSRQVDHRDVQEVLDDRGNNGVNAMIDMIGDGNIRLMPEVGGINLAVKPNATQMSVLRGYINHFKGEVVIDIDKVGGDTIHSFSYTRGTSSSKILSDIKAYFDEGIVPEQKTSDETDIHQFLYSDRKVAPGMTDSERYEALKQRVIYNVPTATELPSYALKNIPEISSWDDINKYLSSEKRDIIRKIANEFGVFDKELLNEDIELTFEFSRNNFEESYSKQKRNYIEFAKIFSVFNEVVEGAIGVEIHNRAEYKTDPTLDNVFVLMSAYQDGEHIVPVKLEVKKFKDKQNTLYVAISLEKIKMTEVSEQGNTKNGVTQGSRSVNVSIARIFSKINPSNKNFLKYLPDGFLNDAQRVAKQEALKEDADNAYKSAIKRNDMQAVQRMVDKAAKEAGYTENQVKSADLVTYDENGNVIPLSERFKSDNDDPRYSDRNKDSVSNRALLANALESTATNEIERKTLDEYKEELGRADALEKELAEIRSKIRDLSFAKGPKDTEGLRKLREQEIKTVNRIDSHCPYRLSSIIIKKAAPPIISGAAFLFVLKLKPGRQKVRDVLADGDETAGACGCADVAVDVGNAADTLPDVGHKGNMPRHHGKIAELAPTGEAGDLPLKHRARGGGDLQSEEVHIDTVLS